MAYYDIEDENGNEESGSNLSGKHILYLLGHTVTWAYLIVSPLPIPLMAAELLFTLAFAYSLAT
jgi:hypothetical protein